MTAFLESAIDDIVSATAHFGTECLTCCALQIENVGYRHENNNVCADQVEHIAITTNQLDPYISNLDLIKHMYKQIKIMDPDLESEPWMWFIAKLSDVARKHNNTDILLWLQASGFEKYIILSAYASSYSIMSLAQ